MKPSELIGAHNGKFFFTISLVLLDAGLIVLFPLFIGFAIDGALDSTYAGVIQLGLLGLATLLVGSLRRLFDSRFYANIYRQWGQQIGEGEETATSEKSAHLGFLTELVEFFENMLPELINNLIGLVGTLVIIASLDVTVFVGCLLILLLVLIVYGVSGKRTTLFNNGFNDELEQQVGVVEKQEPTLLRDHLKKLMRWNVKLSDLETVNFSIIWFFMMVFLVVSIIISTQNGMNSQGMLFSLVLYLFQFIESSISVPLYYQQWLRLGSITKRLSIP